MRSHQFKAADLNLIRKKGDWLSNEIDALTKEEQTKTTIVAVGEKEFGYVSPK